MAKAVLNACVFSFGNELIEFLISLKYSSKAHFTGCIIVLNISRMA